MHHPLTLALALIFAVGWCHVPGMPLPLHHCPPSPESALAIAIAIAKDRHSCRQQQPLLPTTMTTISAATIHHCCRTTKSTMKTIADNAIALSPLLTAVAKLPSVVVTALEIQAASHCHCIAVVSRGLHCRQLCRRRRQRKWCCVAIVLPLLLWR